MYCNCDEYAYYRNNPIVPDRLLKVLAMAIWPAEHLEDPGQVRASLAEAEAARKIAVRYLVAIQPDDIPQLQEVLAKIMGPATSQPGALVKLLDIYQEAAKRNPVLPPPNIGKPAAKTKPSVSIKPSGRSPKASGRTPKASAPPKSAPKPSGRPRDPEPEGRRAPRPSEACRSCDGKGYRIKVDKENVMKETKVVCSKCGGTGKEPPPSTGKGRRFGRGPHVEETEEEEDINRKADNFLRRHGLDKWGRGSS